MPVIPLRRTANVRQMPTQQIAQEIEIMLPQWRNRNWTPRRQQYMFSRAMELYHRRNVTNAQDNRALGILRSLAMNYNRVWANNPLRSQLFAGSNVNYGSNSNEFMPYAGVIGPPRANNNAGLYSLFINTKLVKLPTNKPIDPISHHVFKKGDVATRVRQNGKNVYFRTGPFNSWFGHDWKHMNPNSNAKISNKKHPLTRATVTRRNVSRVRFV
jgi:hypothetical protein